MQRFSCLTSRSVKSCMYWQTRCFAASKVFREQAQPSIKSKILQIYKLTHPDLFGAHPEEQKKNEQSLQQFQNFLDEYKGWITNASQNQIHNGVAISASRYKLEFYTHKEDQTLKNTIIVIRGPPPNCGIMEKSTALAKNLQDLFVQLGLSQENKYSHHDVIDYLGKRLYDGVDVNGYSPSGDMYGDSDIGGPIIEFMRENLGKQPEMSEYDKSMTIHGITFGKAKQAEIQTKVVRHKIAEFLGSHDLRLDIYSGLFEKQWELIDNFRDEIGSRYGIDTSHWSAKSIFRHHSPAYDHFTTDAFENDPPKNQYELQYIRQTLASLRILIGPGPTRVHGLGHVILAAHDHPLRWINFIVRDLDRTVALSNRKNTEHYLHLEKQVAAKLHIKRFVSENDVVFLSERYRSLLHELSVMDTSKYLGNTIPEEYKHVTVVVHEFDVNHTELKIHSVYGYVIIPLTYSPNQVLAGLVARGQEAGYLNKQYHEDESVTQRMLRETKDYLELMRLEHVVALNMLQVLKCCEKMVSARKILKPWLQGKSVCISDGYDIRPDGTIEIPYDF